MRKADERALLSKEKEKQRSASEQSAKWTAAIVGGILLLIAAMEIARGYKTMRVGSDVSRFENEKVT